MATEFFIQRPTITPTIYVYELIGVASHKGYIKIGYTERDAATRIKEQLHTAAVPFKILYQESAMREDGSVFTDKDIHRILERRGFRQLNAVADDNEWYNCSLNDVKAAIVELKTGRITADSRTAAFRMRPEQQAAVKRASWILPVSSFFHLLLVRNKLQNIIRCTAHCQTNAFHFI